jgi:integrase
MRFCRVLRTKSGLPKHCTYQPDRDGKVRVRFRRRGVSVYLTGIPWSEDFMRQYTAALEREQGERTQIGVAKRSPPGSFSALCVSYYAAPEFRDLKESTKRVRRNILERFRAEHGHRRVKDLHRAHINTLLGTMDDRPEAANNLLKVLRVVLKHAVDDKWIENNPALGVKRYRNRNPDGRHTWTESEIAQFQAAHPINSRAGLAFALALYTGSRKADVARLGWQHVRSNRIAVSQQKTGARIDIPIHPELSRALEAVPKTNLTFLITERSAPFSIAGFGNWFRRMCNAAGLPQCSIHGLRKAACRRLAQAGCTEKQIAAISGHTSLSEVARYTKQADRRHLADQALERQLRAEREQNVSEFTQNANPVLPSGEKAVKKQ